MTSDSYVLYLRCFPQRQNCIVLPIARRTLVSYFVFICCNILLNILGLLCAVGRIYGSPEDPGMFLIELLETYPHYLGDQEDVGDLPFMFKVLSINKALSIQARPYPTRNSVLLLFRRTYDALLSIAVYCYIMLYVVIYCCLLLYVAVYCYLLLSVAIYCCILLSIAIYCYTGMLLSVALYCYLLISVAIYCYLLVRM